MRFTSLVPYSISLIFYRGIQMANSNTVDIGEEIPIPAAAGNSSSSAADSSTAAEGRFGAKKAPLTLADLATMFKPTSLAADKFSWQTALSLAVASKLAYSNKTTIENTTTNSWKLASGKFIEEGNAQCFIASTATSALIAFRGTEEFADWIDNISIAPKTRLYGKVHSGFFNGFDAVKEQLEAELNRLSPKQVLITGHSLGGALATVAAAEWSQTYPISSVYTFGQPAVGRGDFIKLFRTRFSNKFFRFVNDDDIVTRVPPNYKHIGKLLHFGTKSSLKSPLEANESDSLESGSLESMGTDPTEPEMLTEAEFEQWRAELSGQEALEGFLPSVTDHTIDDYIRKIGVNAA